MTIKTTYNILFLVPLLLNATTAELSFADSDIPNEDSLQTAAPADNWPGFRGSGARGISVGHQTAVQWNVDDQDDAAIKWRVQVPGLGHSSPTIFGDRVFVATAIASSGDAPLQVGRGGNTAAANDNDEQSWVVLCYDKHTGRELWRKTAKRGIPRATRHTKATHANTTIAANTNRIVAFFGSEGLYCFNHDGELLWERDLGIVDISKYGIGWGYASSPAIYGDRLALVCDDPKNPYAAVLNLNDGKEIWRQSREKDCERSWGTPLIHAHGDVTQVVVNGWPWIVSYDLETGKERWRMEGGGDNPVPTPFVVDDRIYLTSSHGGKSPIHVINQMAKGNLSEDAQAAKNIVWQTDRGGSYMSTPVVWGDYLYLGNTNGTVRCFHAITGEKIYEERLGRGASITASLVAADDKVYFPSEDGTMFVLQAGPKFKLLAANKMSEPCFATPAVSEGILYVRTTKSLMAIQAPKDNTTEAATSSAGSKPNILFIAVDDLRPNLGCYSDPHAITPHLDALAKRGMQFDAAYCQVAVCNPSRASLMTGLRPDRLGVWTLPIHFREAQPDAVTLPQWLRQHGYTAVSHGKIYHNPTPDPQSWSEPIRPLPRLPDPYPPGTSETVKQAMKALPGNDWRKNNLRRPSTAAPELEDHQLLDGARTRMAIEDLRRLGSTSEPFFLAMGFIRPHLAFVAPKKYWDLYDPDQLPVLVDQTVTPNTPKYALSNNSELSHYVDLIDFPKPWDDHTISESTARRLMHAYYACVSYVDAQIGLLLAALEEEGLAENTIVVLWSDHGWKLGEHRGWGKMSNYEVDTRVPFLMAGPGINAAGHQTDSLVELLDIYPTLCELTGVPVPDFVDGKSLVPVLKDPTKSVHKAVYSQYYRKLNGEEYMGYAMRTKSHRLVEWRDFETGEVTARELYDHQNDASEKINLLADSESSEDRKESAGSEIAAQLISQLAAAHPPKGLRMLPAIHSSPTPGRFPADLTIQNRHGSEIVVYPITPTGRRGRSKKVPAGESVTFNARIGGVYVVESTDGKIHQIHSPAYPQKTVEVKE